LKPLLTIIIVIYTELCSSMPCRWYV